MSSPPNFEISSAKSAAATLAVKGLLVSLFIVYLILRLVAWQQTVLVEDHDSLVYLDQIKIFRTLDLEKIISMRGFTTQFYSFTASLLNWPGWSVETSARLSSLLFSSLLFVSLLGMGKEIAGIKEAAFGLILLTFSPVFIPFSFSILAEPTYVALIYTGLWLFWTQYNNPKTWKAGLLGFIFGLAFLTRIEGFANLFVIPFLQGVLIFFGQPKENNFRRYVGWTTIFMLSFSLLAGAHIWRVSHKFGYFAIDERQVWTLILQAPDGRSYDEKLGGLDYSPSQVNLDYVRAHPEVQARFASNMSIKQTVKGYVKTVLVNLADLYQNKLNLLIGPLGLLFFCVGLYALFRSKHPRDGFLVLAFLTFNLVGPLLYQVQIRYIAVIFPLMMLVAGIGIVHLAGSVAALWKRTSATENALCVVFLFALLAAWIRPLYGFYSAPRTINGEYSPESLREPARIIKEIKEKELLRPPILSARKGYLTYHAEAEPAALPYTNMEGLIKFCTLNKVDFLFLEYGHIGKHPFLAVFAAGKPLQEFALLYRGTDAFGRKLELYRFQKTP